MPNRPDSQYGKRNLDLLKVNSVFIQILHDTFCRLHNMELDPVFLSKFNVSVLLGFYQFEENKHGEHGV